MKWWRVVKVAVKVGLAVGKVKETKKVNQIVAAVDKVIAAVEKEKAKT